MRVIDSIRMATRWSSFRALILALGLIAASACVRTSKYYVPTAGDSRLDEYEFRSQADQLMRVECERLKAGKPSVSGEGTFVLEVAGTGSVQRVKIMRSTGDASLDDIFGALAARLDLQSADGKAGHTRMRASYFCEPDKAVTTIEMT